MEETNTGAALPAKRPTFLTVLCILSFIGIGFSLIGGIMGYFSYSTMASAGDMFGGLKGEGAEEMGEAMNAMADVMGMDYGKMALNSLVVALLNIPILIGVLMMWKQKKTGFFVYTAFELIQCVMPFILVGGLAGGISGVLYAIVAIVFIVLYGLNLKHMS
jgi:hypothetical protein